jgi:galactose-1-phosphate uridylyltransferase
VTIWTFFFSPQDYITNDHQIVLNKWHQSMGILSIFDTYSGQQENVANVDICNNQDVQSIS